ncbi:uncharacterized protein ACNLHF_003270 isoform 3-T3 [Anomaloglossus baeobatrachus]
MERAFRIHHMAQTPWTKILRNLRLRQRQFFWTPATTSFFIPKERARPPTRRSAYRSRSTHEHALPDPEPLTGYPLAPFPYTSVLQCTSSFTLQSPTIQILNQS